MDNKAQCSFKKPDGSSCKATCLSGEPWCFFHSPNRGDEREEARRRGGRVRNKPAIVLPLETADAPLESVADVVRLVSRTINQVLKGEVDAKIANAAGYLASVMLRALQGSELEQRIADLEARDREHDSNPVPAAGGAGSEARPAEGAIPADPGAAAARSIPDDESGWLDAGSLAEDHPSDPVEPGASAV